MIFGIRLAQTYILGDKKGSLMEFDNLQRNLFNSISVQTPF